MISKLLVISIKHVYSIRLHAFYLYYMFSKKIKSKYPTRVRCHVIFGKRIYYMIIRETNILILDILINSNS